MTAAPERAPAPDTHAAHEAHPPAVGGAADSRQWRGVIEEYRAWLPVSDATPVITLREGGTPLIHSESLSLATGCDVWLKFDGANPTGSFKDRGMTVAISKAVEEGAEAVICASTGNTSAAAAAYAAKAGLVCGVVIPNGKVALGKLAQALVHGSVVIKLDGNFDAALGICRQLADDYPVQLVNSVNPYRIEGQKTAAFEVCDFLGRAPDVHILPVGNAGNITAYWKGYQEYLQAGRIGAAPRMCGFQAAGAAPIVTGKPVDHPTTIATAIRIGNPASWDRAVAAADESGGLISAVTDRDILRAYGRLAREGVFAEMASAASVAGLLQLAGTAQLPAGAVIVCTLTGHGLKDPDWAIAGAGQPEVVPVDVATVASKLGLG
jgi:threonine synthase